MKGMKSEATPWDGNGTEQSASGSSAAVEILGSG